MRRTAILATLGPASNSLETIEALIDAGADAFRLNFSHGTRETHAATCARVRAAAASRGRQIAVLQDLSGPKIRIGLVEAPLVLDEGASLTIARGEAPGRPGLVACSFDALFTSVSAGHRLLLDDGRLELEVTSASPDRLLTRVVSGGMLDSHKGINVPGVSLRTSALTDKDRADLVAGLEMGVDLVAISFVQTADDIRDARAAARAAGAADVALIAKIEKPQAVEHIDDILGVADGVMVARGDLGIEVPLETLPAIQHRLVRAARRRGVPVILATQVLESMRSDPRPTRAEVTDAAHAVDQQVDAIMLAGETASGRYPVRAVSMLDAIVREAEKVVVEHPMMPDVALGNPHGRALCEAAVTLAVRSGATAIVALTEAGNTARTLAALRPAARIVAATPSSATAARLALVWGVTPLVIPDTGVSSVRAALLARGDVSRGDIVVLVSTNPALGGDGTNFVHVERL